MMTVTEPVPRVPTTGATNRTGRDQQVQLTLSVLVVVLAWFVIRPIGLRATDGVVLALLVINSLFMLGRLLSTTVIPPRAALPLLCCWAVVAAALLALRSETFAPAFCFFVAGSAGYRLATRPALFVATLAGVLSTLGLWIAQQHGVDGWPPLLGLTVALPVFLGMANRSRDLAVASTIAAAKSAQRAAESESRERALAERARISRDIHDVLAHSLSGVSMQLELSEMLLDDGQQALARDAIGKAHSMVREGMAEARRAVTALRVETLPLDRTLRAQFWGAGEVAVTGDPRELTVETGQTLIRAAQEALTNARRYAVGGVLDVLLEYRTTEVELRVSNGPGMRPRESPMIVSGSGMGLVGMRERAALLGGRVEAGPIVDGLLAGGWRVAMTLPTGRPADTIQDAAVQRGRV